MRWFHQEIAVGDHIFNDVCDHYHLKMNCPHRKPNDRLYEFADEQFELANPDGIILRTLKFCHPWTFEKREIMERYKVPRLHLDTDYSNANTGQLRTRIQAFIEMLLESRKGAES